MKIVFLEVVVGCRFGMEGFYSVSAEQRSPVGQISSLTAAAKQEVWNLRNRFVSWSDD